MFRMRAEVDDWFKHIFKQGPIQTKFDLYYLCLIMGLASGTSDRPQNASEFVDHFVSDYRLVQRLILGLLIVAEMSRLGLDLGDRAEVQGLINQYLEPTNPAQLKDEGFARLNDYANGGFQVIAETFGAKPYHLENFLQWYGKELTTKMDSNPHWSAFSQVTQ